MIDSDFKKTIHPKVLKNGDIIGIIAPANSLSVISKKNIAIGISNIEKLGLKVRFSKNAFSTCLDIEESISKRVEDFMEMIKDPNIVGIMAGIGGFNSNEILDYLDYELIAKFRKPFIGFSDITAINTAIYTQSHLLNFSGPSFAVFCQKNIPEFTVAAFRQMLMGNGVYVYESSKKFSVDLWYQCNTGNRQWIHNRGFSIINHGNFKGRCIGGNLQTLIALAGTKYFPEFDDTVLFIEETNNKTFPEIRRYLSQIKQIGILEKVNALVFGRFYDIKSLDYQEEFVSDLKAIALKDFNKPILCNVDFGHTDPMFVIPIGGICEFINENLRLYIK